MKKFLFFALAAACTLSIARADEFKDFGEDYGMWKGAFAVGDIDDNGTLDVIFSGEENGMEKGGVFLNDGNGNFTPQAGDRLVKLGLSGNIEFGDINGDGHLDIIFCGWGSGSTSESKGIALNDGNGNFTLADSNLYPILGASKVTSCGFADFNMDGLLDYYFFGNYVRTEIEGEEDLITGNCVIYFQNPDGSFTADTEAFPVYRFNEPNVTIVDFDNDGYPDIWVNAGNEANECDNETQTGDSQRFSALFKNDGFGKFSMFNFGNLDISFQKSNGSSSWADVDGDGFMDLLHSGDGYLCTGETDDRLNRVYKNLNGGGLEEKYMAEVARSGHFGKVTAWVDWNGDGKLDFITGGWDYTAKGGDGDQVTYIYLGQDSDDFTFTRSTLGGDIPGVSEQTYVVADLNNDRKPDFLECGYGSIDRRVTGWVRNTTSPGVTQLEAPINAKMSTDPNDDTRTIFSWEAPESLKGKPGITWNLSLKNTTTGKWFYNPMAVIGGNNDGWRKVSGMPGNVYANTEYSLYELPAGEYEWTVQAIDGSYLGGKFADTQKFTISTSGVNSVDGYQPAVYVSDNVLKIVGEQGALQTVNIYSVSGALINNTVFTSNINMEMPVAGVYIVEVLNQNGGSYKTKVAVK